MNLQKMTDKNLLDNTKSLISKENQLTAEIISHIEEIETRKLYSEYKFRSLFDYCTSELGYSEDQACRRINAMRVARKVPAIKGKIGEGSMNLTTANLLSGFLGVVKLTPKEQSLVINRISNSSKRECIYILN